MPTLQKNCRDGLVRHMEGLWIDLYQLAPTRRYDGPCGLKGLVTIFFTNITSPGDLYSLQSQSLLLLP